MGAVIDSNVFIYAAVEDSEYHENAMELIHSLDRWIVPTIVIYETVWNFRKLGFSTEEAKELVEQILFDPRTSLADDRQYLLEGFELLENLSLTHYNDSVVLATAKDIGTLATYDKKLRNRAAKLGIKLLPEELE
ncbi:PIN domain-containing protein [Thermococcus radiotolerans]|uniref:Nucleotide-binding protein n=1 Tax=Thermococcus radiotolerans TaxID=187880 RepID=A0A2Z2N1M1_9EURY|nr:PIN domain-containing protein [Thermococcus radiotolerans]ASJ14877.1 nucleotide-binding protein [Thermococcus radiotolerans]